MRSVASAKDTSDTAMLPHKLTAATTAKKLMFFNYLPLRTFYIDKFHGIKKAHNFYIKK